MKILKELKAFEEHCLENNDLQAELIYNAQETIQVLIEDRDSLISVAEAYIDVANDTLEHHGVPKTVNMIYAEKHLEESIKEAKDDE